MYHTNKRNLNQTQVRKVCPHVLREQFIWTSEATEPAEAGLKAEDFVKRTEHLAIQFRAPSVKN